MVTAPGIAATPDAPARDACGENHHAASMLLRIIHLRAIQPKYFIYALMAVGAAFVSALLLQGLLSPALFRINDQNVALLFMIACAFVAGRFGLLPGLVASVVSFVTFNYYFTIPYHSLQIATLTDALNLGIFLFAAVLTRKIDHALIEIGWLSIGSCTPNEGRNCVD